MDHVPIDHRLVQTNPIAIIQKKQKIDKGYPPDEEIIKQYESKVQLMNPVQVQSLTVKYHNNNRSLKKFPYPRDWPSFAQFTPYHDDVEYYASSATFTIPLAYIFLGDFLSSFDFLQNGVGFKAYAVKMQDLLDRTVDSSSHFPLDIFFNKWVDRMWLDDEYLLKYFLGLSDTTTAHDEPPRPPTFDIFRRCLIFGIEAKFKTNPKIYEGHLLLVMLEIKKRGEIEIVIVDNHEPGAYVYDIHRIILNAVTKYLIKSFDIKLGKEDRDRSYKVVITSRSFNTDALMGCEPPTMECVSFALRACIYLRLLRDYRNIKESRDTFIFHKNIFLHHIYRMIHWIHDKKDSVDFSRPDLSKPIPSPSLEMTRPVFELNTKECYISLLHYIGVPPLDSFAGSDILEKIDNMADYVFENITHKNYKFNKNGKKAFSQIRKYDPESMSLCRQMSQFKV
jgi:hypothetical protein